MGARSGEGNFGRAAGKGKGSGRVEKRAGERARTISFSNLPKGTRANVIKDFIKKELGDAIGVEDIYTCDERTTKGMARFETLDGMCEYMGSEAGRQKHEFQGRRIYTDIPKEGDDAKRERAVRKRCT